MVTRTTSGEIWIFQKFSVFSKISTVTPLRRLYPIVFQLKHDEALRCVIIRAMGGRAFCTGADLKERATMTPAEVGPFVSRLRRMVRDFQELPGTVTSYLISSLRF